MENQKQTSCFSFEIDNFWEKINAIRSPRFLSGGCEWFVELYPKGMIVEDHYVSLFLFANPETLRLGWKRRASFSFILLNQSGKELGRRRPEFCERLFCAYCTGWGRSKELPLKKLKEKGSLENSKLIVKVEIQVHEVVDEGGITGKEMVDVWGFRVLCSQAIPVSRLFQTHRDIAANFRQKSELVKTAYMNHLLGLIETLNKPPNSFTDAELSNARIELIDLTQAGFKVGWLMSRVLTRLSNCKCTVKYAVVIRDRIHRDR
ncbi:MATH domain and coiled-coil domain-containing protein At2g42470 [Brassica napus]|uniref:MATH domain and coiled-coil domain-containing protein At2g42470 n=1 Tax=Brassica napus TaxID=3708 RepID=UPI00207A325F|nr:MATH domain and coiled-coil domain-containing protein At2g42470 [Brassica napus]